MPLDIRPGDFSDPDVVALIAHHFTTARAQTAEESAHALDLSGLQVPGIHFWTVYRDGVLAGFGALKVIGSGHGEVKSMHTREALRGAGIGAAMLTHILNAARAAGLARVSLETGSMAFFAPAVSLYRKFGFVECAPFADYVDDPNSIYMTLELGAG